MHETSNKPPEEFREVITPSEERFEKIRSIIGLFLGPIAAIIIYFIPISSLDFRAHVLASVIAFVVIWWVTEPVPIPVTALLGAVLCVLLGAGDAKQVFAPFADPLIFLFIGSFMIAKAMSLHGLDKRFAYSLMSLKWVGSKTARILFVFGFICAFISMWISNTASTAMMMPIGIGIVSVYTASLKDKRKMGFGTGLMLMAAYASSTGGIGTPVGTPPNIIGIAMIQKFTGYSFTFFQWMTIAVPMLIIMYIFLFLLMYYLNKPEAKVIEGSNEFIDVEKKKLGKWTRGQVNTVAAFLITVFLWILPGIIAVIYGGNSEQFKSINRYMPEAVPALIGAILLFLLPVNWSGRKFTITWKDAVKINWGTILLFGGGLSLGGLMFETKLADVIGKSLTDISGAESLWGITLASIFISIIVSEATSNTASANMVIPVMISIAIAAGVNPIPPALGATLGASWGFMLPVSTPPNAIVYGTGLVPIRKMIKAGFIFDIAGGFLIWLGLRIILPVMGFS
ncbi:MAG: DASS family sodium-coupled anion symporter [Ignavibacteriae bacterium]|nr:MAG: DASS family sodium-coupled anion symporter [Ignavibacteriota bacterium]